MYHSDKIDLFSFLVKRANKKGVRVIWIHFERLTVYTSVYSVYRVYSMYSVYSVYSVYNVYIVCIVYV